MRSDRETKTDTLGLSSPEIAFQIEKNLKRQDKFDWDLIKTMLPLLSMRFSELGLDQEWIDHGLLCLSQIKEDIPGFLHTRFQRLEYFLNNSGLTKLSPLSLEILVNTISGDEDEMFVIEEYRAKLAAFLNDFSEYSPDEELVGPKSEGEIATNFSEPMSMAICARVVLSILSSGNKIYYNNYSGPIYSGNSIVGSEFFGNDDEMVFVRCGHLFFIDTKYRYLIPPDVEAIAGNNIIFIDDMEKGEFGCRLGYFTCNTLTTLFSADLRNKVVVDAGSGTSNLSLAMSKLGAKLVIGIDNDVVQLDKATRNIAANEMSDKVLTAKLDLQETDRVLSLITKHARGSKVVIVSNIGYWKEYPLTNLTCIKFADDLSKRGITVTDIITGGNDPAVGSNSRQHEKEFLDTCIKRRKMPTSGTNQDILCMKALGFSNNSTSISEVIYRYGSFPRQAESVHGFRR